MKNWSEFINDAKAVYNWMEDDLSKELFCARLEYAVGQNYSSLQRIVACADDAINTHILSTRKFDELKLNAGEVAVLYGAGRIGRHMLATLSEKFSDASFIFCDGAWDSIEKYKNVPIISPADLGKNYKHCKVLISNLYHVNEILENILHMGFSPSQIYTAHHITPMLRENNLHKDCSILVDPNQYFDEDIISFGENEVFIDGGTYDAGTTLEFIRKCPSYKKVILFEPFAKMKKPIQDNTANLRDIVFHDVGLWDKAANVSFTNTSEAGNRIVQSDTENSVKADCIDNICKGEPITFIKLDIETAELNALIGAQETIKKHKPKLAICVYHKPEDIIEIPLYIKSLVPEYQLYMRHYSNTKWETVLYAVL